MSEGVQALERGLRLLNLVAFGGQEGWGVNELVRASGMHKTTVIRVLASLQSHRYVDRDERGRYRIGPAAISLGASSHGRLREIGRPYLTRLAAATGETALLHVLHDNATLCIDKVDSPSPIRVTYEVGSEGPLYAGTSGKVLLAFMPQEDQDRYLKSVTLTRLTETTIVDPDALRANLDEIRRRGYVATPGELDANIYGVGCPIWNRNGDLEAGLALVGPAYRWTEEHVNRHLKVTQETAAQFSEAIGYRPTQA